MINKEKAVDLEGSVEDKRIDINLPINLSKLVSPDKLKIVEGLNERVIGQNLAKDQLADFISRAIVKIGHQKGPLGTLFLHGPTGVGKTELSRALSNFFFGVDDGFIKIDCSEFTEEHTKSRFFGAPPSYTGYGDPAIFDSETFFNAYDIADKMGRLNPIVKKLGVFNIVLFDEIEKAHNSVIQSLLGILDEGKLLLSDTTKVPISFGKTIVIFTSNIGEQELNLLKKETSMGFFKDEKESDKENIDRPKIFKDALNKKFSPEFLGRIDSFAECKKLNREELDQIIDLNVKKFILKFNSYFKIFPEIQIDMDEKIYDYIIEHGYDEKKGARNLVKIYNKLIESQLELLFSMKEFSSLENKQGILKVKLYIENDDVHVSLDHTNLITYNSRVENLISPINKVNNDVLIHQIGEASKSDLSLLFPNNSSGETDTYKFISKNNLLYILKKDEIDFIFNDMSNFYGDFDNISLQGNIMNGLNINFRTIERLIGIFTIKYAKLNSKQGFIEIDKLKNDLIISLYNTYLPICEENNIDIQRLMKEFFPIIVKLLSKIG